MNHTDKLYMFTDGCTSNMASGAKTVHRKDLELTKRLDAIMAEHPDLYDALENEDVTKIKKD